MHDDLEGALYSLALVALAAAVLLVCWRVSDLEKDIEIIRLTVPVSERDS